VTNDELVSAVGGIFHDLFDIAESDVTPDLGPDTLDRWDSLQHLNVILAVEQTFGVECSPEEMDGMRSVRQILDVLRKKLGIDTPAFPASAPSETERMPVSGEAPGS